MILKPLFSIIKNSNYQISRPHDVLTNSISISTEKVLYILDQVFQNISLQVSLLTTCSFKKSSNQDLLQHLNDLQSRLGPAESLREV